MQKTFPGLKPSKPTIRTERVARAIATRIVNEVNLDDFYWQPEVKPDRIDDVTREIVRCGRPATVFHRLWKQQPYISDSGQRAGDPYGWEGIEDHCEHIADEIAAEELAKAMVEYERDYGNPG